MPPPSSPPRPCGNPAPRDQVHRLLHLPPPGLKAFRQQLRKNARTKGFLGLNKIKGLARQVCQPSASRATRGGLSAFQLPAQSLGVHGSGAGSREGRGLLEEVLHQQRYARSSQAPACGGFLLSSPFSVESDEHSSLPPSADLWGLVPRRWWQRWGAVRLCHFEACKGDGWGQ